MSLNKNELKCSVCKAYLFEEDDVVYCPVCGAPHHRDCYNSIGHCGLEELHGTENQYDREKQRQEAKAEAEPLKEPPLYESNKNARDYKETAVCKNCGANYPQIMNRCPKCGTPNNSTSNHPYPFIPFDILGGVPADMDLGKGVTAKEAARFVASNPHRYMPKFAAFNAGQKVSWNWLAFIFPSVWFLSRKMYKIGAFLTAITIALSLLTLPMLTLVSQIDTSTARTYFEVMSILAENINLSNPAPLLLVGVSCVLNIIMRIFSALFGDFAYRNYAINTISDIKEDTEADFDISCRKKGGISFIAMLIGFVAVEYLPSFLAMFI